MPVVDVERLEVYAYAAPEAAAYVTIMRRFTETLLAAWSAQDLVERGVEVRAEVVDVRLRYLAAHGNLIESLAEVRVSSIVEYQRQPARFDHAWRATGDARAALRARQDAPRRLRRRARASEDSHSARG